MQRHKPTISWLELLEPVINRGRERAGTTERFERIESVPRKPIKALFERAEEEDVEESEGGKLPPRTREALRDVIGLDVDQARIHVDEQANEYARSQRADAVTIGKEIYFRSEKFAPQSPAGLGLIAHELTHVAESNRPGVSLRRATSDGVREEERLASRREQIAAQLPISPVIAPSFSAPSVLPAMPSSEASRVVNASSAHPRPMRADDDRRLPDAPLPQPAPNIEMIRRTLFRDLMSQIRVEFERGA
jgi:hypothetical protein